MKNPPYKRSPGFGKMAKMKIMNRGPVTAVGLLFLLIGARASAQDAVQWPVEDGGNGHWYQAVEEELSWFEAGDRATASGGYLASITSSEENQMLCNAGFPNDAGRPYWTCGVRQGGSWSWQNGDTWGYTNWDGSEPNGCCGYGGYGANYLVWRPWYNVAACGWDDTNPFHCTNNPGCTPRTLIEYSADCNEDGIVDYGQILDGTFEDTDGNGVPDCCETDTCGEPAQNNVLRLTAWPDAAVIPHDQSVTPDVAMTIEFWVKAEGGGSNSRPITKRPGDSGCYTIDAYQDGEGCVAKNSVFGSCGGAHWEEIPCEWSHLALTVDGETGIARAYLNGNLVSENDAGGPCSIAQGSWDLRFGNTPDFTSTQYIGCLDNIRIWNKSLDQQEVRYWMQTDITPEVAGGLPELGGSWDFENGVLDATGVNNGWLEGSAEIEAQDRPDPVICEGDLDASGAVDGADLGIVLGVWGPCGDPSQCPEDINRDGVVDGADLAALLSGWGFCP